VRGCAAGASSAIVRRLRRVGRGGPTLGLNSKLESIVILHRICIIAGTVLLASCGAEVAGTAATAASLQAAQAQQAQARQKQIERKLSEAMKAGAASASAAQE
jgi:hypothetical protein